MREREIPNQPSSVRPSIEHQGMGQMAELPFVFEVNTEALGHYLQQEAGLSADAVKHLTFRLIPASPVREVGFEISESGVNIVNHSRIGGQTHVQTTEDGHRFIDVFFGTPVFSFLQTRSMLIDFSFLSKHQEELTPALERVRAAQEPHISGMFTTKRMVPYLQAVDWQRAGQFLDKFLAQRFSRGLAQIIIHEANHIKSAEEAEKIERVIADKEKRIGALKTLGFILLGGGVGNLLLQGIGNLVTGSEGNFFLAVPAGFGLGSGASFAVRYYLQRGVARRKAQLHSMAEQSEQEAQGASLKPKTIRRWEDIITLQPNPNYHS